MTTERGFIALARGILDHPIVGARKPLTRHDAWEWLLFETAWKSRKYAGTCSIVVDLERGQLAHSTRYMSKAWGWPETTVRRFLSRLKTGAMIGAATGAGITVITICNYDAYQQRAGESGAGIGAATGAKMAQQRRRKEQGNKVIDISLSETFSEWYATYPRKKARQDAWKAYCKLISSGAISHADLMARTRLFADHWKASTAAAKDPKREIGYCPYPASWLNSGEYADEIEAAPSTPDRGAMKIEAATRDASTFTEADWRDRLALIERGERWPSQWGPKPGEPGCLVPAALLVRPISPEPMAAGGAQ